MEERGHTVLVTAGKKEITFTLLEKYGIEYINVGTYGTSFINKILNFPIMDIRYYRLMKKIKPDIFVGFGSIRAAHISFLIRRPCINFEDTEHSTEQIRLYLPFVEAVCTPSCYTLDHGSKHIRFNGYMELASLHPNRFTPNPAVLTELGLTDEDPFIILRFVSWEASHDIGHKGLTFDSKRTAIQEFKKFGRVFITSEKPLIEEFERYRISISPDKMHDLLYYATLLYGESATMASECAVLGTHSIFCDFKGRGYTDNQEFKYGLVYNYRLDDVSQKKSIEKAVHLLENPDLKRLGRQKQSALIGDTIDVTAFMIWLIENYPESINGIKKNLPVQGKFN